MIKKIAIIGAGYRGIGSMKILMKEGHEIDVYEQMDDMGGVWHPSNHYLGLTIHTPAKLNHFFDVSYDSNINLTQRTPAHGIHHYLKSFCENQNLMKHISLNTLVSRIQYDSKSGKSVLTINDKNGNERQAGPYDYVINTHGYSDTPIPEFKEMEKFKGSIIHSFQANAHLIQSYIDQNKKITVLGGGKTATDIVLGLYHLGYNFIWVYREAYWFFRFNKLRNALLGKSHIFKYTIAIGFMLMARFPRLAMWILRIFRSIDTYGKRHTHFTKFHASLIDDSEFSDLKECSRRCSKLGDIDYFDERGFYLKDGQYIESDLVICCTGSFDVKKLIPVEVDGQLIDFNLEKQAYRGAILPKIPNIIFTGYHVFLLGLCDGEVYGRWISNYINSGFDRTYLEAHAKKYDFPFFTRNLVFQSDKYFFSEELKITYEFIHDHEIKYFEFWKYYFKFFFDLSFCEPLPIKPGKKSK